MLQYKEVHERLENLKGVWVCDSPVSLAMLKREIEKLETLVHNASDCYLISSNDYYLCLDAIEESLGTVNKMLYGKNHRITTRIEVE